MADDQRQIGAGGGPPGASVQPHLPALQQQTNVAQAGPSQPQGTQPPGRNIEQPSDIAAGGSRGSTGEPVERAAGVQGGAPRAAPPSGNHAEQPRTAAEQPNEFSATADQGAARAVVVVLSCLAD